MRKLGWFASLGIFLVGAATWAPLLVSGHFAILWRDVSTLFYPAKFTWAEGVLRNGFPPLWDSSVLGGTAFFAESAWGSLNPLNVVFLLKRWVAFPLLFSWFLALHHVVLLLGAYRFGREATQQRSYALLCAFLFGTLGATWSCLYMPHMLGTLVVMPWLFWAALRFHRAPSLRGLFLMSALVALPVWGGDPQASLVFGLFAAGALFRTLRAPRALAALPLLAVLAALFAAPQLLPTLSTLAESDRVARGLAPHEVLYWSFHPARFAEWVWPVAADWQARFTNAPNGADPFLRSSFVGLGPILIFGALVFREFSRWRFTALLALLFLSAVSIGAFWPSWLTTFLVRVPGVAAFRYPERLEALVGPALVALLVLRLAAVPRITRAWESLLCGLVAFQLAQFAFLRPHVFLASPAELREGARSGWAAELLAQISRDRESGSGVAADRFFSEAQYGNTRENPALSPIDASVAHSWRTLAGNIPELQGVRSATGFRTLAPEWYHVFWNALAKKNEYVYTITGVRYLAQVGEDGKVKLALHPEALPKVFVPQKLVAASSLFDAQVLLLEEGFDWRTTVVVGSQQLSNFHLAGDTPNHDEVSAASFANGGANISLVSRAAAPARLLVFQETFSNGWRARVNGAAVPVVRANGWAIGVPLPPVASGGATSVQLEYQQAGLAWGLLAFGAWLLALAGVCLRKQVREVPAEQEQ